MREVMDSEKMMGLVEWGVSGIEEFLEWGNEGRWFGNIGGV